MFQYKRASVILLIVLHGFMYVLYVGIVLTTWLREHARARVYIRTNTRARTPPAPPPPAHTHVLTLHSVFVDKLT